MSTKNWILFCVMALLWGAGWSVTKIGLGFVPPFSFSAQQFLLSATILLPFVMASRGSVPKDRKTLGHIAVYSLINAANIAVTNIGLLYESAGTAAMLTFTQPLIVYGLSILFLRKDIRAHKLLGVLIGFLGVSTLSLKGTGGNVAFSSTSLLIVLGAFLWAVATLYFKAKLEGVNVTVTLAS